MILAVVMAIPLVRSAVMVAVAIPFAAVWTALAILRGGRRGKKDAGHGTQSGGRARKDLVHRFHSLLNRQSRRSLEK
jgi:hypothetical protein